ncbi:unnamed protein product [Diamesa serratosioi]
MSSSGSLTPLGSSSATGNPRNKTALKPGHSLIHWIRLGNSGVDLVGNKGQIRPVSYEELSKHNKCDDLWMAIRGNVYNLSYYLDFHPGGHAELMKGAGKDATKIFDEVHAWVNYEKLLSKCYVGPLRNTATITFKDDLNKLVKPLVDSSFKQNSKTIDKQLLESTLIPRFDWIQKLTEITLYFYTKGLANPYITVEFNCDTEVNININNTYTYLFTFNKPVNFPCSIKVNQETGKSCEIVIFLTLDVSCLITGKIEIIFVKQEHQLWTNFGIFDRQKVLTMYNSFSYVISARVQINHDSYALILKPKTQMVQVIPIAYHVSVTTLVMGEEVTRKYTPIPLKYCVEEMNSNTTNVLLFIKAYDQGFSKFLTQEIDDIQDVSLSSPCGNFDLMKLRNHKKIGILAAGSGITPIISILDYLLKRNSNHVEQISLYYFNKTIADIWFHEQLKTMEDRDARFKVTNILSEPASDWDGIDGRINKDIVAQISEVSSLVLVCGPIIFNSVTEELLKANGKIELENIHIFKG